ncbi:hypothetical protein ACLB2K_064528 [Fragaria x ananassa]
MRADLVGSCIAHWTVKWLSRITSGLESMIPKHMTHQYVRVTTECLIKNKHYGTPVNPCAPDRVPGGSSSGSAGVVGADLADFSLGTDTGGSVRVPASYCGIFGFRPSHGAISTSGVTPMAQSFDTVGWFARDPVLLSRVGRALLQIPDAHPVRPVQLIIAEDCFQLSSIPTDRVKQVLVHSVEKLFGVSKLNGHVLKHANLGDIVKDKVPSLNCFFGKGNASQEFNIPSLAALSSAMRILQRHEFKTNHGEWIKTIRPDLGPGISERVWEAVRAADENTNVCYSVKTELRAALTELLGDAGVLAIPTVPGPPPKLQMDPTTLETFRARAFSLLSIAGVSGFSRFLACWLWFPNHNTASAKRSNAEPSHGQREVSGAAHKLKRHLHSCKALSKSPC